MRITKTCKLPKEVVIGFGYGVAPILIVIMVYFGLAYLTGIIGPTISSSIVGTYQVLVAAIMNNLILVGLLFVSVICAICGWFEESQEAGDGVDSRSETIAGAMLISAVISGMVDLIIITTIQTNQACLESAIACHTSLGFSWTYFIQGILVIFGGFVIGWLGHWCKRCIRIVKEDNGTVGG
jgi:hypothetical protein